MGSVQSSIVCKYCGNDDAFEDYDYKRDIIYILCDQCGYFYHSGPEWDENGKVKLDDNGKPIYKEEKIEIPYGAYRIVSKGRGIGESGSIINEEQYNHLKKCAEYKDNIEYIEVSRFINGIIEKEKIEIKEKEIIRIITPEDPYGEENWDT